MAFSSAQSLAGTLGGGGGTGYHLLWVQTRAALVQHQVVFQQRVCAGDNTVK